MSVDLVPMVDRRGLEHWFQNSIFKVLGTGSPTLFIVVLGTGIQNTCIIMVVYSRLSLNSSKCKIIKKYVYTIQVTRIGS